MSLITKATRFTDDLLAYMGFDKNNPEQPWASNILKMLNRPKKLNAVRTKRTDVIFFPSLPLAPFVFTLWYLLTVWVDVIACFGHVMSIKGM
jgi:hypothetical protein